MLLQAGHTERRAVAITHLEKLVEQGFLHAKAQKVSACTA